MKKFVYASAAILLPTIVAVLVGGLISDKNGFWESFQAYGFIVLPIVTVIFLAGKRATTSKVSR